VGKFKDTNLSNGSITVEASIIVPIVVMAVTAIVYMSILWFCHSSIHSIINKAAERGAASWRSVSSDINTGKTYLHLMSGGSLYWRLYDKDKEIKLKRIKEHALFDLSRCSIIKPVNIKVDAETREYIIYKKVVVTVESSYKVPAAGLLKIFGFKDTYTIKAKSESIINDSSEFIRNTDFIIDLERELESRYPELRSLAEKSRSVLHNTKQKVKELVN